VICDGNEIGIGTHNGMLAVMVSGRKKNDCKVVRKEKLHTCRIHSLLCVHTSQAHNLWSCDETGRIAVRNWETLKDAVVVRDRGGGVHALALWMDKVVCGCDAGITLIDTIDVQSQEVINGVMEALGELPISCLAVSDRYCYVAAGNRVIGIDGQKNIAFSTDLSAHISSIALMEKEVIVGLENGCIEGWDETMRTQSFSRQNHERRVVAVRTFYHYIISCGADAHIIVRDVLLDHWPKVAAFKDVNGWVNDACLTREGVFCSGGTSGELRLWRPKSFPENLEAADAEVRRKVQSLVRHYERLADANLTVQKEMIALKRRSTSNLDSLTVYDTRLSDLEGVVAQLRLDLEESARVQNSVLVSLDNLLGPLSELTSRVNTLVEFENDVQVLKEDRADVQSKIEAMQMQVAALTAVTARESSREDSESAGAEQQLQLLVQREFESLRDRLEMVENRNLNHSTQQMDSLVHGEFLQLREAWLNERERLNTNTSITSQTSRTLFPTWFLQLLAVAILCGAVWILARGGTRSGGYMFGRPS